MIILYSLVMILKYKCNLMLIIVESCVGHAGKMMFPIRNPRGKTKASNPFSCRDAKRTHISYVSHSVSSALVAVRAPSPICFILLNI